MPTTPDPSGKPPYRVPSMAEIAATQPNGYRVVSTFSGAGGSCLGFRMAGFRVVWASEFIAAARETYLANWPDAHVDARDIRRVTAKEVLAAAGLGPGEVDVLEGSPPCASFSTAGKREQSWGKVKAYSDGAQRTDDLFFEYARLLEGIRPRVFVAENVSGLVKGTAKGYFKQILRRLRACGYRVEARLLDAQWLGVPQARQRLFFVGVRDDLGRGPAFPAPLGYRYSVRDALPWLAGWSAKGHGYYPGGWVDGQAPAPSVLVGPSSGAYSDHQLAAVPGPRLRMGAHGFYPGRSVDLASEPSPTVGASGLGSYAYDVEAEPEADISRYAIGAEWERLAPGEQSGRYFNLVRAHPDRPSPTVTVPAGIMSAATVTHPTEKRKFTIPELKRICAFPDDFTVTGSYPQQWERLGRAVPPLMMRAVAEAVRDQVLTTADG
jgi:DNA (cytosine-5)-methyltransferase 1